MYFVGEDTSCETALLNRRDKIHRQVPMKPTPTTRPSARETKLPERPHQSEGVRAFSAPRLASLEAFTTARWLGVAALKREHKRNLRGSCMIMSALATGPLTAVSACSWLMHPDTINWTVKVSHDCNLTSRLRHYVQTEQKNGVQSHYKKKSTTLPHFFSTAPRCTQMRST